MTGPEARALFCPDALAKRHATHRYALYRGWGGYPFADEGYEWMERTLARNRWQVVGITGDAPDTQRPSDQLRAWPDVGDWPYHIVLRHDSERTLVIYVEGDVYVRVYDDDDAYQAGLVDYAVKSPCP